MTDGRADLAIDAPRDEKIEKFKGEEQETKKSDKKSVVVNNE